MCQGYSNTDWWVWGWACPRNFLDLWGTLFQNFADSDRFRTPLWSCCHCLVQRDTLSKKPWDADPSWYLKEEQPGLGHLPCQSVRWSNVKPTSLYPRCFGFCCQYELDSKLVKTTYIVQTISFYSFDYCSSAGKKDLLCTFCTMGWFVLQPCCRFQSFDSLFYEV